MNILEQVKHLVELGYYVFPLIPNDKRPATPNGCKDATRDVDQITKWWSSNPMYNVGIKCENIYVIDVDIKDHNGLDDLKLLENEFGNLPETLRVRTASGGKHLYFKRPEGNYKGSVKISYKGLQTSIDIRVGNQYVVAPPSIFNGHDYSWENDVIDASVLPELPDEWKDFLPKEKEVSEIVNYSKHNTITDDTVIQRAKLYVDNLPPAVSGSYGQKQMFEVMNYVFNYFDLSLEEGWDIILDYNSRCEPPWDIDNQYDYNWLRKTAEKVISSAKERGGAFRNDVAVKSVVIKDSFFESLKSKSKTNDIKDVSEISNIDYISEETVVVKKETSKIPAKYKVKYDSEFFIDYGDSYEIVVDNENVLPEEILHIPGYIEAVMGAMKSGAPVYSKHLCFAGAISLLSTLIGPYFKCSGNYANMYLFALARSGSGKDTPRRFIKSLLQKTCSKENYIGRTFSSGEAIEDEILQNRTKLYMLDECDILLSTMSDSKESYHKSMQEVILEMYSSVGGTWQHRSTASAVGKNDKVNQYIYNPYLNIFGTAPPANYYAALNERMTSGGLFGRLVVIKAGQSHMQRNCTNDFEQYEDYDKIVAFTKFINNFKNVTSESGYDLQGITAPINSYSIPLDDTARDILNEYREIAFYSGQSTKNETQCSVLSRSQEFPYKFALLYAISSNWSNLMKCTTISGEPDQYKIMQELIVTPEAARWAVDFTQQFISMQLKELSSKGFVNVVDKNNKDVIRFIQERCNKSSLNICTDASLRKHFSYIQKDVLDKILKHLVESEQIAYTEKSASDKRKYKGFVKLL